MERRCNPNVHSARTYGTAHKLEFNTHSSSSVESFEAYTLWQRGEENSSTVMRLNLFFFLKKPKFHPHKTEMGWDREASAVSLKLGLWLQWAALQNVTQCCDRSLLSLRAFCHLLTDSGNHMTNPISHAPFHPAQAGCRVIFQIRFPSSVTSTVTNARRPFYISAQTCECGALKGRRKERY